jgi:drug/metabolite transporter (DMT)-like permease
MRAARVMGSRDDRHVPDLPIPSSLAVVALGLLASVGWGIGDFGGGLTSRRAPFLGVLLGSQVASLFVGVPILLLVSEPAMRPIDAAVSIVGGLLGGTGLALLYRGLSVGRMGVVAPVAAVLTATMPVVFGFVTEGVPSILAIVGIAAAALSVVLVSRSPQAPDGRPSGLRYALGAGTLFGLFTIVVSQLDDALVLSPIILIRVASVGCVALLIVGLRQEWRVPRPLWPALLGVGVMDMGATALYLMAIAIGPLAIASILASLYPVVTTVLATLLLRERVTPAHAAGILAAGVAVVLIAGGASV